MTNKIVQAMEHGAGKLAKTLGEDAGKAVKNLYHDTGHRLKRVADNHVKNEGKTAEEFEKIAKGTDDTPVYHLDDAGNVKRLRHDPTADTPEGRYRKEDLTDEDMERLGLKESSVGAPRTGERHHLLKNDKEGRETPRPTSSSRQVPPGSNDLAEATQLARHADNSYGTRRGDGFTSNNYAAAHVKGANGKGDFILVGRSHQRIPGVPDAHSERMIGTPFLRQGEGGRIQQLYTEREPCSTGANCSSWMAEKLSHVQVSHSIEYGGTKESRDLGNGEMRDYLDGLLAAR